MYNSPIFVCPKNGNWFQIVQYFRKLNAHSHINKYSMKEISKCIGNIGRVSSTFFSFLDLTSGFWQMTMHPNDAHLTALTIPSKGQLKWITSPMGLLVCPASFQKVDGGCYDWYKPVCIDDLLIHTASYSKHLLVLDSLLERLCEQGLKLNFEICVFGNQEFSDLVFILTPNGIYPGKDKTLVMPNHQLTSKWFVHSLGFAIVLHTH